MQNIEKILDLVEELFDELENTDVQDLFESLPDMEQDEVVELRSSIEDWVDGLDEVISRLPELQSSIVELKADLERLNDSVVELKRISTRNKLHDVVRGLVASLSFVFEPEAIVARYFPCSKASFSSASLGCLLPSLPVGSMRRMDLLPTLSPLRTSRCERKAVPAESYRGGATWCEN